MDSSIEQDNHQHLSVGQFAEKAYLTYAMSTVLERALPFVEDGQKPVQRRILYAMRELGSRHDSPYKKSARIVGDVIGKFHPHGDVAVYEAAVRMAQDFTLRYPLISGQGNFGTRDGDSPAAMRYTEIRLSLFAEKILLSEIEQDTIDFKENYDGSLKEPKLLPARLPILLLNGVSGIAVGMATEIPAHNLREVANACIALLRYKIANPQLNISTTTKNIVKNNNFYQIEQEHKLYQTDSEQEAIPEWQQLIYQQIPAPDFPGGGKIISSPEEIHRIYQLGRGSIRVRACWQIEALARGQYRLIFTHIPPNTNVARVLSEIDELVNPKIKANKKSLSSDQLSIKNQANALIESFRDDSDQSHPVRIIIEPRSKSIEINDLVNFLLARTSLETNVNLNMTVIGRDGRPCLKSLVEIISEWCDFRQEVVLRRIENRFAAVEKRVHILEGRKAVLLNIDEVIRIIRQADDAKLELKLNFALSDEQAEDILEIRLRQLSKMESIKIEKELLELQLERDNLLNLLDNQAQRQQLIIDELNFDLEQFADDRRTILEVDDKTSSAKLENVVDEAITVILSQKGFIRQRSGHNIDNNNLNWKDGDTLFTIVETRSIYPLVVINDQGRSFTLKFSDIPGGKGDGVPLSAILDEPGKIIALISAKGDTTVLIASSSGYGFTCILNDLVSRTRSGKAFVSLNENEITNKIFVRLLSSDNSLNFPEQHVAVLTNKQRLLIFPLNEIKNLSSGGKGVQLVSLEREDSLSDITQIKTKLSIRGVNRLGNIKEIDITEELVPIYLSKRAKKGKSLPLFLSNTYLITSND